MNFFLSLSGFPLRHKMLIKIVVTHREWFWKMLTRLGDRQRQEQRLRQQREQRDRRTNGGHVIGSQLSSCSSNSKQPRLVDATQNALNKLQASERGRASGWERERASSLNRTQATSTQLSLTALSCCALECALLPLSEFSFELCFNCEWLFPFASRLTRFHTKYGT